MSQEQVTAKLSQIHGKGLETIFSLSEAALENAQKLAQLNYAASKDLLVNAQDGIQQILIAKDSKQVAELLGTDVLQATSRQAVIYQRKVTKVLRDGGKEFTNIVDASLNQLQDSVQDCMNTLAANAPAGSDVLITSLKTINSSALQGFEQLRAAIKDALVAAEKTADQAIGLVQGQIAQVNKVVAPVSTRKSA